MNSKRVSNIILTKMKKTNFLIFPIIMGLALVFVVSCDKDDDNNGGNNAGIPVLTTTAVTEITPTTAISGGNITSDGGATLTDSGLCWSTDQNPTINDNKTSNGNGSGSFISNLEGLTANTTYYVRAYAINQAGTGYGGVISFTTLTDYSGQVGTVTDNEGNTYETIGIGSQIWMAENLKTTKFSNGDVIPTTNNPLTNISNETNPKYFWTYADLASSLANSFIPFIDAGVGSLTLNQLVVLELITQNQATIIVNCLTQLGISELSTHTISQITNTLDNFTLPETFGLLYTWYVIADSRKLCPAGWRLPNNEDWAILGNFLGGMDYAGEKLKDTNSYWNNPNYASNSSGFSAVPAGGKLLDSYKILGDVANFWSSSETNTNHSYYWNLTHNDEKLNNYESYKYFGYSVRCIKE